MDAINKARNTNICQEDINEQKALSIDSPIFARYKETRDINDLKVARLLYCQQKVRNQLPPVDVNKKSTVNLSKNSDVIKKRVLAKQHLALSDRITKQLKIKNNTINELVKEAVSSTSLTVFNKLSRLLRVSEAEKRNKSKSSLLGGKVAFTYPMIPILTEQSTPTPPNISKLPLI